MQTAGARALRGDDNEMSREAVLLHWEAKIEAAERREGGRSEADAAERSDAAVHPRAEVAEHAVNDSAGPAPRRSRRFERTPGSSHIEAPAKPALQLVEDAEHVEPGQAAVRSEPAKAMPQRVERAHPDSLSGGAEAAERRTIVISGQPSPPSRRRSLVEAQIAEPDRIALWAFLLGLFLVAVAAGSAHA